MYARYYYCYPGVAQLLFSFFVGKIWFPLLLQILPRSHTLYLSCKNTGWVPSALKCSTLHFRHIVPFSYITLITLLPKITYLFMMFFANSLMVLPPIDIIWSNYNNIKIITRFFYKKPFYKKPRTTEAKNEDPKKFFYCETESRLLFFKFCRKITEKGKN